MQCLWVKLGIHVQLYTLLYFTLYHHYEISAAFSWSMPYQSPIVLAIINLREPSAYKEQGEDDDNNNDNNNDNQHLDETLSL